jgi:hypothetical protein
MSPSMTLLPYLKRFSFFWKFLSNSAAAFFYINSKVVRAGGFFSGGLAIEEDNPAPLDPNVPLRAAMPEPVGFGRGMIFLAEDYKKLP